METPVPEYAFDIKMAAVIRMTAKNLESAENAIRECLDCASLNVKLSSRAAEYLITEASVSVDDADFPFLFEVDKVPVVGRDGDAKYDNDDI